MKKALILCMVSLFVAGIAFAEGPGTVGFYGDAAGTLCNYEGGQIANFATETAYIVAIAPHHSAVEYAAPIPDCLAAATGVAAAAQGGSVIIGDIATGVSVGYGVCKTGAWAVGKVTWTYVPVGFGGPTIGPCCTYPILPHGTTGAAMAGCESPVPLKFFYTPITTHTVNGDATCDCANPVRDSTWGQIKALYN
jgi:hypothetical protein